MHTLSRSQEESVWESDSLVRGGHQFGHHGVIDQADPAGSVSAAKVSSPCCMPSICSSRRRAKPTSCVEFSSFPVPLGRGVGWTESPCCVRCAFISRFDVRFVLVLDFVGQISIDKEPSLTRS